MEHQKQVTTQSIELQGRKAWRIQCETALSARRCVLCVVSSTLLHGRSAGRLVVVQRFSQCVRSLVRSVGRCISQLIRSQLLEWSLCCDLLQSRCPRREVRQNHQVHAENKTCAVSSGYLFIVCSVGLDDIGSGIVCTRAGKKRWGICFSVCSSQPTQAVWKKSSEHLGTLDVLHMRNTHVETATAEEQEKGSGETAP